MKKITAIIVGSGLLALLGCSSAMEPEDYAASEQAVTACTTGQGKNTTKAALAVAMATELGRWDPMNDLAKGSVVTAKCSSCTKTKAILGQQTYTTDQNIFNNVNLASDLNSSFDRQVSLDNNLKQNHPDRMPVAHKLTKIAGPTNLGKGACGSHYVFQADHLDGTPLTATEASNLKERLCYFGMDSTGYSCGGNAWIAFLSGGISGCPSGKQCVAIDPDWNDGGVTADTSAGAIPQYPYNRLLDTYNTMQGTQCQLYLSNPAVLGKMQSKCASYPSTCGYQYCIKN